jgi:hypothetical protein
MNECKHVRRKRRRRYFVFRCEFQLMLDIFFLVSLDVGYLQLTLAVAAASEKRHSIFSQAMPMLVKFDFLKTNYFGRRKKYRVLNESKSY